MKVKEQKILKYRNKRQLVSCGRSTYCTANTDLFEKVLETAHQGESLYLSTVKLKTRELRIARFDRLTSHTQTNFCYQKN